MTVLGQEQRFWSEAELRTVARLRSLGWTRVEIAAELGRTSRAVKWVIARRLKAGER